MRSTAYLFAGCIAAWLTVPISQGFPATVPVSGLFTAGVLTVSQAVPGTPSAEGAEAQRLLRAARQAMDQGDFALAEKYIGRAEGLNVRYDPLYERFMDTPAKVRRALGEMQAGRSPAAANQAPANTAAAPPSAPAATPAGPNASPDPLAMMAGDANAKARACLDKGRLALQQGDVTGAIAWRQRALATGASFAPGEYSPDALAAELRRAGVSPELLAAAPGGEAPAAPRPQDFELAPAGSSPAPLAGMQSDRRNSVFQASLVTDPNRLPADSGPLSGPAAGAARPQPGMYGFVGDDQDGGSAAAAEPRRLPGAGDGSIAARKAESLRLLAIARAALDRGDLRGAQVVAEQARSLAVPDLAFAPNEPRPDHVLMEIDSALGRRGGSETASPYPVTQAYHPNAQGANPYPVTAGVYRPAEDSSRMTAAQALLPQTPPGQNPAAVAGAPGVELYHQGLRALEQQRRDEALDLFGRAWQYQEQLDPATRQALRDKLTLLRVATPLAAGPAANPLEEVDSQQQLMRQKLSREVFQELSAAERVRESDPRGSLARLQDLRTRVEQETLDPPSRHQMLALVDRGIQQAEQYIQQHLADIELRERNQSVTEDLANDHNAKLDRQNKLAELVEKFNDLVDEQRYAEAEVLAKQARELDPESEVVRSMLLTSKFAWRVEEQESIKALKESGVYDALTSVESSSAPFDDRHPLVFGDTKNWDQLSRTRGQWLQEQRSRMTPAEQEIQSALKTKVDVRFGNQPLAEVVETLGRMAGVNVYLDPQGLHAEGITTDAPITITLTEPISLRSALNLILEPLHLSYVIQNEVLRITSEQTSDSNTFVEVYNVADLVIPIPNFIPSYNIGLPGALREAVNSTGQVRPMGPTEPMALTLAASDTNPAASTSASVLAQMGSSGMLPSASSRTPSPNGFAPGNMGGASMADFDTLIDLITQTIAPQTWDDVGGPGSVEGFPTNLSLVVSQTQEVHEQIADLLDQLRRLQDLQVTIEVRFITLNDRFFERIGIDFDFDIDDNSNQVEGQVPIIPDDTGPSMSFGLDPTGAPTVDFDYQFNQGGFASAVPQFGGFDASTAANFGFAILSDIEVFFLLEAAQGDDRTNVLQAPKVTLFNGQTGFVSDTSQRPFVMSVIPVVGDFAAAHQPVVVVLSEGTSLSVQAVVSPDRRFVRLTLIPFFSSIGEVDTFTFTGKQSSDSGTNVQDPANEGETVTNNQQRIVEGTTVQLPTFNFTTVSTTVSVPDGGTVLLGGIKRLSEGRNERGVPMLNKLPYINRLFKNVGIGRDTQSLMMMVTPRIIIQEEEELLQTGYDSSQQ